MSEAPELRLGYQEYNFDGLSRKVPSFVDETIAAYSEIIWNDELSDEEKANQIGGLTHRSYEELFEYDIIDCPTIIHKKGLILPIAGEGPVAVDGQIYGQYCGLNWTKTLREDESCEFQLFHIIKIEHIESDDNLPDLEDFDSPFAQIPVTTKGIEILRAPISVQGNENWLYGICRDLYYPNGEWPQPYDINDMYERIKSARYSKYPTQRNIDWFFDQLDRYTPFRGIDVHVTSSEFFVTTPPHGEVPCIESEEVVLNGHMIGFTEMYDYRVVSVENSIPVIEKDMSTKILAVFLEVEDEKGRERIVRVPLRACYNLEPDKGDDYDMAVNDQQGESSE